MSEFVSESHVFLNNPATSVDEVLSFLSDEAVKAGLAEDASAVLDAFKAREAEGTTGMMGGFAIPHAKSDAIKSEGVFVVKFAGGVDWPSMDNAPIKVAIALLSPAANAGTTHLSMLSKVAVLLMDESFRSSVLGTDDAAQIAKLIDEGLAAE